MKFSYSPDMRKVQILAYKKGWSWEQLAKNAGVSISTLFSLQSKRRKASELTVFKIAQALKVDPDELIEGGLNYGKRIGSSDRGPNASPF